MGVEIDNLDLADPAALEKVCLSREPVFEKVCLSHGPVFSIT